MYSQNGTPMKTLELTRATMWRNVEMVDTGIHSTK